MEFNDVKTIAVIGAGDVGHGISLGLALAGYQVNLNSTTEASLQKGMDSINADLDRLVEFGFAESDRPQAALNKISTTSFEEASRDCDVVIEAVYENLELKQQIFRDLDAFCPERTILASSTSTIIPSRFPWSPSALTGCWWHTIRGLPTCLPWWRSSALNRLPIKRWT